MVLASRINNNKRDTAIELPLMSEETNPHNRDLIRNSNPPTRDNSVIWKAGDRLPNGYRIIEQLGSGGFGITYRALTNKGEEVVIKTLNSRSQNDENVEKFKQDIRDEATTLAQLKTLRLKHIVEFQRLIDIEGLPCLVMEYIEGTNLKKNGQLPPAIALDYLRKIAIDLEKVHQLGIVHRDIKPENIILEEGTNRPVLVDFGTARCFETDSTATIYKSGDFTAPEQKLGEKTAYPQAVDVYSLGMTLYSLISGVELPKLSKKMEYPESISLRLKELIRKSIQKETEKRSKKSGAER